MVSILVGCQGLWGEGHFYVFSFLLISEHSEHADMDKVALLHVDNRYRVSQKKREMFCV